MAIIRIPITIPVSQIQFRQQSGACPEGRPVRARIRIGGGRGGSPLLGLAQRTSSTHHTPLPHQHYHYKRERDDFSTDDIWKSVIRIISSSS